MRQTGPNLLRHTITRLWHYNIYIQKPYEPGYLFIILFKPLYLLEVFLTIYKPTRLQSQNRRLKHIDYGRKKLYNLETGMYKFINFRIQFSNGHIHLFCNYSNKNNIIPNLNELMSYKKIHFHYTRKFTRFTYITIPDNYFRCTKKITKIFCKNKTFQFANKYFPLFKNDKVNAVLLPKRIIKHRYDIKRKIKKNLNILRHLILIQLKEYTKMFRIAPIQRQINFFEVLKQIHNKEKQRKTIYLYKKNKKKFGHIFKNYIFINKTIFYTKRIKTINWIKHFWYIQMFNRLLEYQFANFIKNLFLNNTNIIILLQQEFIIPRALKLLEVYKQNMRRTTNYLKHSKFYKSFINILPIIQTFHGIDILAKQIALELTRTKRHWRVVHGTQTLVSQAYVHMRNEAINGSAGLSGLAIIISGCFERASRTRTIKIQLGIITKASFYETDVIKSVAFAKATRGSFSVTVIASS